jgi:hypothetical protein
VPASRAARGASASQASAQMLMPTLTLSRGRIVSGPWDPQVSSQMFTPKRVSLTLNTQGESPGTK